MTDQRVPVPTFEITPSEKPEHFYVLMHCELTAKTVARLVALFEEAAAHEIREG